MEKPRKIPSTQDHIDIEDIRDDITVLKNGTAVAVLQTTSINFDLLSESEQDAMIFAFASLLNSLTYPIQIFIRSKRLDISGYTAQLDKAREATTNQNLAAQINKYESFVKNLVSKNQVLDKRFYIVIPDFGIQIPQPGNLAGVFHRRPAGMSKWNIFERARTGLQQKSDHLEKLLGQIGIRAVRLGTKELVELFYDIYNPEVARKQRAALGTEEYTTPMVEPKMAPVVEESQKEKEK